MDQKTTYSYQRTPGLDCPKCGVYFPTTIPDLLSGSIRCPYCGLTLYIDRKESGHAMQAGNAFTLSGLRLAEFIQRHVRMDEMGCGIINALMLGLESQHIAQLLVGAPQQPH